MSLVQNTTLLRCTSQGNSPTSAKATTSRSNYSRRGKKLTSKSSVANLIQLVRDPIGTVGEAVETWYDGLTPEERETRQHIEDRRTVLYVRLRNALGYADWKAAADELDVIEGNNAWKTVIESEEYDASLIQARLRQLDEARISCDVGKMLFLVRTALTRELGNMGNIKLYKYTHVGTKDLIERYITSALDTLDVLLDISGKSKCDGLESRYILEQVLAARQSFGRSALLLSGGATFGMNHMGVLKTLWQKRLLPRIISGASAGSIVCAVLCTRTDEEVPDLLENFCHGDLAVFEEEGNEDSILRKISRFLKIGALFDISHLTRVMREMLGDLTFQEAYNRTRRILNICVSSASLYELPRLLNYVTAPNVLIWSAVAASCSVPFLFSPASLLAKDPKTGEHIPWSNSPQRWLDGSVDNDLPMTRLAEMFNVNHFIVSQVNPHVVPFLEKEEDSVTPEAQQTSSTLTAAPTWIHSITHLAKGEALHRMYTLVELGVFPNYLTKAVSVLSQKYSGDITIFPAISYADFPRMLSNPTTEFMINAMLTGERATWPKLSRIRNHCAIELALDDAVQKLRTRVVFSSSQVDLRLGAFVRSTSEVRKRMSQDEKQVRRKFSQTSDLDLKDGRLGRSKDQRHQKARSINIPDISTQRIAFTKSPNKDEPPISPRSGPNLNTPQHPLVDILSSGAETSNISATSSDNDNIPSSTTDSPNSPTFFSPAPELWPSTRPLFPYATQPNTPVVERNFSSLATPVPLSAISPPPIKRSSSSSTSVNYLATSFGPTLSPSTQPPPAPSVPSAAELKYKKLFHSAKSRMRLSPPPVQPSAPPPVAQTPNIKVKRFNAMGLEIDISGTRGMILRRKKSHPDDVS